MAMLIMNFILLVFVLSLVQAITVSEKNDEEDRLKTDTEAETNQNYTTTETGEELCHGDIVCDKKSVEGGSDRNAINGDDHRWPKEAGLVIVPYVLSSSLTNKAKEQVLASMADFAGWTCIKFVERSGQVDYINFYRGDGCWSEVGRRGGKQDLSIGSRCYKLKGKSTHEMMHALGFDHEQSRSDRDQYVTIRLENVKPGKKDQFDICTSCTDPEGLPYDYRSVMHYGLTESSKNDKETIIPKTGNVNVIGQRTGLCNGDIKRLNQMYKCEGVTASPTKPNNGIVPCDEPVDQTPICKGRESKCADPKDDYRTLILCPFTCHGTKMGDPYDRWSKCPNFAEDGKCDTQEDVKKHCSLSCSKL